MEYRDARKLTKEAKEEVRRQAVKMHRDGKNYTEIAQSLEVHRSTVRSAHGSIDTRNQVWKF